MCFPVFFCNPRLDDGFWRKMWYNCKHREDISMRTNYSAEEITAVVRLQKNKEKDITQILLPDADGYQRSLEKRYLAEVQKYIEDYAYREQHRLILLTERTTLARQACMILAKGLMHSRQEVNPPEKFAAQEAEEWGDLLGYPVTGKNIGNGRSVPKEQHKILICNRNLTGEKEIQVPVSDSSVIKLGNLVLDMDPRQTDLQESERKDVEWLLLEVPAETQDTLDVEKVLEFDAPGIGIMLAPTGNYEYFVKRLCFEGGYDVLRIPEPGEADYVAYAKDYLKLYGYLAEDACLVQMYRELLGYRGDLLAEQDLYRHLMRCMQNCVPGRKKLSGEELRIRYPKIHPSVREEWQRTVGLQQVKEILERKAAARRVLGDRGKLLHGNYIFAGNPGTGKSRMARLYAGIMSEMGIGNGRFVDASRSDLIGAYQGHTAMKVKEAFDKARGGVLFVDEASFMLDDSNFAKEMVVETVRFMELYPQTTVIFATYPGEAEQVLHCDSGFASRIARIVSFPDYSDRELGEILENMAENYGMKLENGCGEQMKEYITAIRERTDYANAREVRKLLETAVEEYAMEGSGDGKITPEQIVRAGQRLRAERKGEKNRIGF